MRPWLSWRRARAGRGPRDRTASGSARGTAPRSGGAFQTWRPLAGDWAHGEAAAHGDGDRRDFRTVTTWRGGQPCRPLPFRDRLPLVLALETLDAACRVQELLLAGEERVTLGTHLHPDLGLGGAGVDDLPAVAGDRGVDVVGMNASLHGAPPR